MRKTVYQNIQYYKFALYGFFKNLRFFDGFLILFLLSKQTDYLQIGILYGMREITVMVTEIPSGAVADALGRRRTLILSFAVYIASFLIFYLSGSFGWLSLAMVLFAFADAFRSGVHKAMIFHYLQQQGWSKYKTDYYGHTRSWSQTGTAVSSLAGGIIVFYAGNYDRIFLASILPYFLDMMLITSYPAWLDGNLKRIDTLSVTERFKQVEQSFVQAFKKPMFLKTLVSLSLYTGYYKALKDYIQPLIKSFALTVPFWAYWNHEKKTALFIGVFYFAVYLITAWASRHAGKFLHMFKDFKKPMNATLLLGIAAGLVSGTVYLLQWYALSVLLFVLILLIENLRKPIGVSVIAGLTHDHAMATVLSLTSQTKSLFAALLSFLLGWVAQHYGPGFAIALISALLLLFYPVYRLPKKIL